MFIPLEIGTTYSGTIASIEKYGLFVLLNDSPYRALVHVSEIAHSFVSLDELNSLFTVGENIDIQCIGYDKTKDRYQFSRKRLYEKDDRANIEEKDNEATSEELYNFIIDDKDIMSKSEDLSKDALDMLDQLAPIDGGEITTKINDNDGNEKIASEKPRPSSASIIRTDNPPKPGETYMGQVTSIRSYGAFVDIGCNREGMIHVSELSDGISLNTTLQVDDIVQVKVTQVTSGNNIYLTHKLEAPEAASSSDTNTNTNTTSDTNSKSNNNAAKKINRRLKQNARIADKNSKGKDEPKGAPTKTGKRAETFKHNKVPRRVTPDVNKEKSSEGGVGSVISSFFSSFFKK